MPIESPNDPDAERIDGSVPSINVTVNVTGLVTQEALDIIGERIEEAIARAMDEARRMQSDVRR